MSTGHARAPVEKWAGYASTPYMDEAELCTKLAFVNGGEILVQGTPDELVASYRHELLDVDTSDPAVERLLVYLPGILDVNLFGTHYHIEVENAEEAIQWAVQGKLVPQDPSDEPASLSTSYFRKK